MHEQQLDAGAGYCVPHCRGDSWVDGLFCCCEDGLVFARALACMDVGEYWTDEHGDHARPQVRRRIPARASWLGLRPFPWKCRNGARRGCACDGSGDRSKLLDVARVQKMDALVQNLNGSSMGMV